MFDKVYWWWWWAGNVKISRETGYLPTWRLQLSKQMEGQSQVHQYVHVFSVSYSKVFRFGRAALELQELASSTAIVTRRAHHPHQRARHCLKKIFVEHFFR